jgi:hypothetical protein
MSLRQVPQYLDITVVVLLVGRLFREGLISKYRVLAIFLVLDFVVSSVAFLVPWRKLSLDYRGIWIAIRPIVWIFYIWIVYATVRRVMNNHPGILSMSQRVLTFCFTGAVIIAIVTGRFEYAASSHQYGSTFFGSLVVQWLIIERAFTTTSLLLLGATFVFLLWFPVRVPRNIAVICAGLLVYFGIKDVFLLAPTIWSLDSIPTVNLVLTSVFSLCLLFWLIYLNREGENITVQPGHSWNRRDQERVLEQLESINEALSRAVKR